MLVCHCKTRDAWVAIFINSIQHVKPMGCCAWEKVVIYRYMRIRSCFKPCFSTLLGVRNGYNSDCEYRVFNSREDVGR